MSRRKMQHRPGDTLIEVIFAFAILGTIIGFSYSGVIHARKTAVAAQERTQALEVAQFQAEALKAYRNDMNWGDIEGSPYMFGSGGKFSLLGVPTATCMKITTSGTPAQNFWDVETVTANCNAQAPFLAPPSSGKVVNITFTGINRLTSGTPAASTGNNKTVQANIVVAWRDALGFDQAVTNIVILSKER